MLAGAFPSRLAHRTVSDRSMWPGQLQIPHAGFYDGASLFDPIRRRSFLA